MVRSMASDRGSGKSFTMSGEGAKGIVQSVGQRIFEHIQAASGKVFLVEASHIQIHSKDAHRVPRVNTTRPGMVRPGGD